ncbi:hypothetical protein M0R45_035312 [Rubus argutus]|uniref:Uncharacterized protein n=1 Tax=Rubus argutus TaxID=59490 RepID=A0AAW1VWE5_RUBAR
MKDEKKSGREKRGQRRKNQIEKKKLLAHHVPPPLEPPAVAAIEAQPQFHQPSAVSVKNPSTSPCPDSLNPAVHSPAPKLPTPTRHLLQRRR